MKVPIYENAADWGKLYKEMRDENLSSIETPLNTRKYGFSSVSLDTVKEKANYANKPATAS